MVLLCVSKKYEVKQLEKKVISYLETSMSPDDALSILEGAHKFDESVVKEKALTCIRQNGEVCLKSGGILDLCQGCLTDVIKSDDLIAREQTVFECVMSWSKRACASHGIEVTPQNRRDALGDVILQVRFSLLPPTYFVDSVSPTQLLSESEENKIMKCWVRPQSVMSPFISKPRKTSPITHSRKKITVRIFANDVLAQRCSGDYGEGITFSVNTDASLAGFQLYGPCLNPPQTYTISASERKVSTDELVEGSRISRTVVVNTMSYEVHDQRYSLVVYIKGPYTYRGVSGENRVDVGDFSCCFFDYDNMFSDTNVKNGQIPCLMFVV